MKITIYFHKTIQKLTNTPSAIFDIEDYMGLSLAIQSVFPEIKAHFTTFINNMDFFTDTLILVEKKERRIITDKEFLKNSIDKNLNEFYLVPSICGGGGNGRSDFILGAVIAAFAFFAFPALAGANTSGGYYAAFNSLSGVGAFAAQTLLGIGLNLMISSLMQLLTPSPIPDQESDRRNNDAFEGLTNTIGSNQSIPLNYGQIRVAGQLVSGYVKTIDHGESDIIEVEDYL